MKKQPILALAVVGVIAAAAPHAHSAVTWAAGAPGGTSGGSLEFDNTGGRANGELYLLTGVPGSTLAGDYSISMWVNTDVTGETWFFGTQNQGVHLGVRGGDLSQGHWGNDSDGTTTIAANTWYYTTFTYDTTTNTQSIYLNGSLEAATVTGDPNNTGSELILGGRHDGRNGPQWDGTIDDVAIWEGTVLTATEVADLASGAATPLGLSADAYWDFEDDQTGTTAANSGSVGGTLTEIIAIPEPSSASLILLSALALMRRKRS